MLTSYLGVGGCREEKCVSLLPTFGVGVGGCREEKCVSLLARCGWVSGGEMC